MKNWKWSDEKRKLFFARSIFLHLQWITCVNLSTDSRTWLKVISSTQSVKTTHSRKSYILRHQFFYVNRTTEMMRKPYTMLCFPRHVSSKIVHDVRSLSAASVIQFADQWIWSGDQSTNIHFCITYIRTAWTQRAHCTLQNNLLIHHYSEDSLNQVRVVRHVLQLHYKTSY